MCWAWECPAVSSSGNRSNERGAADRELGIRYELIASTTFTRVPAHVEPLFAGTPFRVAEENVQSRIRGALLMALSKSSARGADHRQKSEMVHRLLHALWRHGGAPGGDRRRLEDAGLRAEPIRNREREVIPRATMEKPPSANCDRAARHRSAAYEVSIQFWRPMWSATPPPRDCPNEGKAAGARWTCAVRAFFNWWSRSEYKRQQAAPSSRCAKVFATPPLPIRREGRTVNPKGEAPQRGAG